MLLVLPHISDTVTLYLSGAVELCRTSQLSTIMFVTNLNANEILLTLLTTSATTDFFVIDFHFSTSLTLTINVCTLMHTNIDCHKGFHLNAIEDDDVLVFKEWKHGGSICRKVFT